MATIYVSSVDGNHNDDGLTWATAKQHLQSGIDAAGAGGTVYVDSAHYEIKDVGLSITTPGTTFSPIKILSVDRTGNPEPPTTLLKGATFLTSGNSSLGWAGNDVSYWYGLKILTASGTSQNSVLTIGTNTNANTFNYFEDCEIKLLNTGGAASINIGSSTANTKANQVIFKNTKFGFSAVGQAFNCNSKMYWCNTQSGIMDSIPTLLFRGSTGTYGYPPIVDVVGVDLSQMGAGKSLVQTAGSRAAIFKFENCRFGSGLSVTTGDFTGASQGFGGPEIHVHNCSSEDINYAYGKYSFDGTIVHDNIIKRTGGASDGTTGISRKMMASSGNFLFTPLVSDPICFWNDITGSGITTTVEILSSGVTLKDNEVWIETEYLGTNGFPLSTFVSDRSLNILSSGTAQPLSSGVWTTTGLPAGSGIAQKLETSFTPQEKGVVKVTVNLARPNHTMWYCPKVTVI